MRYRYATPNIKSLTLKQYAKCVHKTLPSSYPGREDIRLVSRISLVSRVLLVSLVLCDLGSELALPIIIIDQ